MIKRKKNTKRDAGEYFDDCFICQSMEKTENGRGLDSKELMDAFAEQNKRNEQN